MAEIQGDAWSAFLVFLTPPDSLCWVDRVPAEAAASFPSPHRCDWEPPHKAPAGRGVLR